MARQSFVADGWSLFHEAILRTGAEVDYFAPDAAELRARRYVTPELYRGLAAPFVEFSGGDIEALGNRADLVKRVVWRWIRTTAKAEAQEYWKLLLVSRNRTLALAELSEVLADGRFPREPKFQPDSPVSVVRYGHWLIKTQAVSDRQPIVPLIWGLALIAAVWREKAKLGYCKFCYRHTYPGGRFCHFHRQSGVTNDERAKAYVRYRKGRLATVIDEERNGTNRSFVKSKVMDCEAGKQSLAEILFPLQPLGGWAVERDELIEALRNAPRVLERIGGEKCLEYSYENIVDNLRLHIDPYKFDDYLWWSTVGHAEQWFALEEIAAPGKRGMGKATKPLVAKAIELAKSGYTNGQIASYLRVAASTVSSWVRRYPAFGNACSDRLSHPKHMHR